MSAQASRLDRLTALRCVGAALVFMGHLNLEVLRVDKLGRLTDPGVSGVDFFFLLSGFVLAWSRRPGATARSFYRRRVARIVPLYLLAWLAGVVVAVCVYGDGLLVQLPSLFFVQAWVPRFDVWFAGATVLWSTSCEAFFYLIFPLLIGPLTRARTSTLARVGAAAIVLAVVIPLVARPSGGQGGYRYWLIYLFPPTRLCEFLLGAVAAVLVSRGAMPRIPLRPALLLAAVVYLASGWAPLYVQPVLAPIVPYTLVIVAAAQADAAGLSRPPRWLVRLGEWSFAFFLFQLTIMRLALHVLTDVVGPPSLAERVGLSVVLFACCLAVGAAMSEFVEKPLERRLRGDRTLPVSLTEAPAEPALVETAEPTVFVIPPLDEVPPVLPTSGPERAPTPATGP